MLLVLSRQVAVDLKTDANFDENRRGPSHRVLRLRLPSAPHCSKSFASTGDHEHPVMKLSVANLLGSVTTSEQERRFSLSIAIRTVTQSIPSGKIDFSNCCDKIF